MYLLDKQRQVPCVWEVVSFLEWKKWLSSFNDILRFTLKRTVTQSLQMGGPRQVWDGADDWGWTGLGLVYHGEDGLMFCLKMINRKHSNISLSPWLPTSVLSFQRGYSYWSFISRIHHKKCKGRIKKYLLCNLVDFSIKWWVGSRECIKLIVAIFSIKFFQLLCFLVLKFCQFCQFCPLRPRWVGGVKP